MALLVGPRAIGTRSFDCLELRGKVTTFPVGGTRAHPGAGLHVSVRVAWSPDGRTIAVTAVEGVFLIDSRGRKTRISSLTNLGAPAWSANGTSLYIAQSVGGAGLDDRLVRLDLQSRSIG